jgi:hypothetical protein
MHLSKFMCGGMVIGPREIVAQMAPVRHTAENARCRIAAVVEPVSLETSDRESRGRVIPPSLPLVESASKTIEANPESASETIEAHPESASETVECREGNEKDVTTGPSSSEQPAPPDAIDPGLTTGDQAVVVDENALFNQKPSVLTNVGNLITDLAGLEEVRDIGSSRFGATRLLRRPNAAGGFDYFAAKYYNAGDNGDGRHAFDDRMREFLVLSHPHVMRIVGVIPPTKTAGPIILTPYSEAGSLADVLERVRRNDPPAFWNDSGKLRMIVGLVSGLDYLHGRGIVHRELKPADPIVESDGSIRICGYATGALEEHRFIRASQVGGPSYMAPERYDEAEDGAKFRDPKRDVFTFGLILYEIVCDHKVFPSTMSAAVIMRRAMSCRPSDRPVIPSDTHPVLRELISRSWIPIAQKRPSFETLWKRMRDCGFKLFPAADVHFVQSSL